MKRFQFLMAMFGVGAVVKGQRWSKMHGEPNVDPHDEVPVQMRDGKWVEWSDPADTLHPSTKLTWYERGIIRDRTDNVFLVKGKPANNQCPVCGTMAEPYRPQVVFSPREIITRCKTCNAAFWQDAEK